MKAWGRAVSFGLEHFQVKIGGDGMVRSYTTTQTIHWDKDGCQFTAFKDLSFPEIQWDMDEKRFAAFKECIVRKDNDNPRYCFGTVTDGRLLIKFYVSSAAEREAAGIDKIAHPCAGFYRPGEKIGAILGLDGFCHMMETDDFSSLDFAFFKERMELVLKKRRREV